MEREPNTIYVASLSYGKDSIAMLHVIKDILHYPLDRIVHAEVWATDTIPADLPPMVEFKKKADAIIKERWGIEVEHICATKRGCLRQSYEGIFYSHKERGNHIGAMYGFAHTKGGWCHRLKYGGTVNIPRYILQTAQASQRQSNAGGGYYQRQEQHMDSPKQEDRGVTTDSKRNCSTAIYGWANKWLPYCTGELKKAAISHTSKPPNDGRKTKVVQYLGIAADEPIRIARHITKPNIILPLVDADWDEGLCGLWCQYSDLLSPIYTSATRGGCWFCHNQGVDQLRILRHEYPELWAILLKWDNDSPVSFHADGHTVHDFDARFAAEDRGEICAGNKFRWDEVLAEDRQLKIIF